MRLVLYQPDIPQNTGAMLRLGACLGVPLDIIEPCGFPFSQRSLRRAGMDYIESVDLTRHNSWTAFQSCMQKVDSRLILLTTQAPTPYTRFSFCSSDVLMVGRESAGVPPEVHAAVDSQVTIPMAQGQRSLNVAMAAAIVLSEALRQCQTTLNSPPNGIY